MCDAIYFAFRKQHIFLLTFALLAGAFSLSAQCPDTGATTVIKPNEGTGFYFYHFQGKSSFRYFLDGKTFSMNTEDDPGRTFLFVDDLAFEPLMLDKNDLVKITKSTNDLEILTDQAKSEQAYFKKLVPDVLITDYGSKYRNKPDGSNDRLFYLWRKVSKHGKEVATQYMLSTMVKDEVFVLSIFPAKPSATDDEMWNQISTYSTYFDLISDEQCAKVLAMPSK